MEIVILNDAAELGERAAARAASEINAAISAKGECRLLLSTGASQFETLGALKGSAVDWSKVAMFHLDEYIGLPITHKASFRKYLKERFVKDVPLKGVFYVNGDNPEETMALLEREFEKAPADVALIGVGENGHIAFNDPPADFETKLAYHVVTLDDACKRQQAGEGWFASPVEVPDKAISMTVHMILQSKVIISAVPHGVKARAVKEMMDRGLDPMLPATALKGHANYTLYLDKNSACLL